MDNLFLSSFKLEDLTAVIKSVVSEAIAQQSKADLAEKLLSPEEACKLFNPPISKVTLHNWEKKDRIKKYRHGGRVVYKYSEIIAGLDNLIKYKKPH